MWAQILNAVFGLFLMAAPGIFSLENPAADNFYIFGPIITTFSVVAWWEATRTVRLWNIPIALWLAASPFILSYGSATATATAIGVGGAVFVLSTVKGKVEKRYGGGWTALWKENALHERESLARRPRHSKE